MHYIINVFVEPGKSLDAAMEPFREEMEEGDESRAWSNHSKWDYWVEGGRWDGYFNEVDNQTTAGELASGKVKGFFDVPYGFLTLPWSDGKEVSRLWHEKEIYIPQGFLADDEPDLRLSHFLPAPNYETHYRRYVKSVPQDTFVHAVDIHS